MITNTIKPPYYAEIFTSVRTNLNRGYADTAKKLESLAQSIPGFLGIESARDTLGITVSYRRDLKAIEQWKLNLEHQAAKEKGKNEWYSSFKTRIAKIEQDYGSV